MKVGRFDFLGDAIIVSAVGGAYALRRGSIVALAYDAEQILIATSAEGKMEINAPAIDERDALLRWFGGLPPIPHHMPQPHDGGEGIGCEP